MESNTKAMKAKQILITLMGAMLFASCSVFNNDNESAKLIGEWEVVRYTGGIMGETLTPDSARFSSHTIRFNPDQSFVFKRGGFDKIVGTYNLKYQKDGDMMVKFYPEKNVFNMPQIVNFGQDGALQLLDTCYDCYNKYYQRKE